MVDHDHVLAPGRLRVLDLVRFALSDAMVNGDWSCTRCGTHHPTSESWSLVFETVRGPRTMVLCRACADEYRSLELGAPAQ